MGRKMSLFDVLRYPVSDKPTLEELERIPASIINKWVSKTPWQNYKDTIDDFRDWYSQCEEPAAQREHANDREEVDLLRKMIAEWEEK